MVKLKTRLEEKGKSTRLGHDSVGQLALPTFN